jgi:hypothetical protein
LGGKDLNKEKCFSCSKYNHQFSECPLVFYAPKKHGIISKNNYNHQQERQKGIKRRARKENERDKQWQEIQA